MSVAPTIADTLDAFVADEGARQSPAGRASLADAMLLLRAYLDAEGPERLTRDERALWESRWDEDVEVASFSRTFGPEKIVPLLEPFLGDYLLHRVMADTRTLRVTGLACEALVAWLERQGSVPADRAADVRERAERASAEMPRSEELRGLLASTVPRRSPGPTLEEVDLPHERTPISRVEPGRLWFRTWEGREVGPVAVPPRAGELAEVGWTVDGLHLARTAAGWVVLGMGGVAPAEAT